MSSMFEQGETAEPRSTRERLVANGEASVNRLPALRAIFQESVSRFAQRLQEMTGGRVDIAVSDLGAGRIGEMREANELCARAALYHSEELKAPLLVVASFDFACAVVELLFGARISEPFFREGRNLTKVERRAADYAVNTLVEALAASLSRVIQTSFAFERVDQSIDWSAFGRRGSITVVCRCALRAFEREGDVLLLIPRAALDPFREVLARDLSSKGAKENPVWTRKLHDQLVRTKVALSAVMEKSGLTLNDVAQFKVGQVIALPISPSSLIPLKCGDRSLFQCTLGQKDGHYTVRIDEFVDGKQEFLEHVLGVDGANSLADGG